MKKIIHKAESRGFADHGWLQANHSFSFANWFDKERIQFGALRVLNDDLIAPSMGFSTHPHQNMEIITIPLSGKLKHKDNLANEWLTVASNEVQVMSAGTGVYHSEMNASVNDHLSLFQLWILPYKEGVSPRYDQKVFNSEDRKNKLQIVVSSFDDEENSGLKIHQNAQISRLDLEENIEFKYQFKYKNSGVYLMNISGKILVDSTLLKQRDAIGLSETSDFTIKALETSELLLVEVPML